jgi:hypothetical protein
MLRLRKVINPVKLACLAVALLLATAASSQEVAEIPFFNVPEGTVGLGGGIRGGQSPYLATDNEDQRQKDLIPLYLYEGKYLFFRGVAGGIHFVDNDRFEFNIYSKYQQCLLCGSRGTQTDTRSRFRNQIEE